MVGLEERREERREKGKVESKLESHMPDKQAPISGTEKLSRQNQQILNVFGSWKEWPKIVPKTGLQNAHKMQPAGQKKPT